MPLNNDIHAGEMILTTIMAEFAPDGTYSACSHQGWTLPTRDDLRQCRIFSRGNHRIKLAVYGREVGNLNEWGAWLCHALIDKDERVWRHIDLNSVSR